MKRQGIQGETIKIAKPGPCAMIKVVIVDGYEDFTTVHNVTVL
jgi:hypothetical protein